ncbi:putative beta-agarase [Pseudomonas aeruginosa]|nr:putative beta-agarase [Pseudomonas aeruginosa]
MIRSRWHLPLLLGLLAVDAPLAANDTQQVLFNFVKPMAVVGITLEDADLPSATAEATPEGDILRRVTFSPAQRPTLRMSPALGRWDWSAADYVSLRIQNAMSWDMTLEVAIEGEQGAPGLQASIELPAGPPQTLLVPLRAVSPEALGMRAGPPMPQMVEGQRVLLAPRVEGSLDRARVGALSLSLRSPQAPQSILLGRFGIRTGRAVERSILTGLIDRYGQYSRADWPEKIRSDEQLRSAYAAEAAQLRDWERQTPARDRFGGLLGGPVFEASGFFRTEKRGGRWWLVTPEGHPFWSLGVNAVTADGSRTYVEGREPMFAELPAEGEPLAAFFGEGDDRRGVAAQAGRRFGHGRWFDFLGANRQRIAPRPARRRMAPAHPGAPLGMGFQQPRQLERSGARRTDADALQPAAVDRRRLRHGQQRFRLVGSHARSLRPALRHGRRARHRHRCSRPPRRSLAARLLRRQRTGLGRARRLGPGALRPRFRSLDAVHGQSGEARLRQAIESQVPGP